MNIVCYTVLGCMFVALNFGMFLLCLDPSTISPELATVADLSALIAIKLAGGWLLPAIVPGLSGGGEPFFQR